MFRFLRCGMIQHYYDITRVRCKVHERRGRRDGASDLPGVLSSLRGAAGYLCTISSVPRHRSPSFRSRSRAGRDGARLRRRRPSPRRRVHLRVKLSRHLVVRRFRLRGGVLRRIGRRVSAVSGGALTLRSLCLRLGLLRHPRELDRLFRRDLRGRRLFGGDASRGGSSPLARASLASAAAATAAGGSSPAARAALARASRTRSDSGRRQTREDGLRLAYIFLYRANSAAASSSFSPPPDEEVDRFFAVLEVGSLEVVDDGAWDIICGGGACAGKVLQRVIHLGVIVDGRARGRGHVRCLRAGVLSPVRLMETGSKARGCVDSETPRTSTAALTRRATRTFESCDAYSPVETCSVSRGLPIRPVRGAPRHCQGGARRGGRRGGSGANPQSAGNFRFYSVARPVSQWTVR